MKISDKFLFSDRKDIVSVGKLLRGKKALSGTSETIAAYEKKLATYFRSEFSLAVSSGTAAIQVALFAVGVGRGDEVIVPSTCPSMTIFPILATGARPVFCDTKEGNFSLNLDDLKNILNSKTKAIIDVPMWGYPTSTDRLAQYAKKTGVPLILDLAQAHGTSLNGKLLSSYADISCFSTHDRKILSTGEGGFLLTNDNKLHAKSKGYIQFGLMNGKDFGLNYKLGGLQAALGNNRIDHINWQLAARRKKALYIKNKINNPQVSELNVIEGGAPNYYSLLLKLSYSDNIKVIRRLDDQGIPSDILRYNYKVLYEYPIFKKYKRKCINSEKLVKSITTIPVHPALGIKELKYIIGEINGLE
jgi:perosamine synthetase